MIDNLTATIVCVKILKRVVPHKQEHRSYRNHLEAIEVVVADLRSSDDVVRWHEGVPGFRMAGRQASCPERRFLLQCGLGLLGRQRPDQDLTKQMRQNNTVFGMHIYIYTPWESKWSLGDPKKNILYFSGAKYSRTGLLGYILYIFVFLTRQSKQAGHTRSHYLGLPNLEVG